MGCPGPSAPRGPHGGPAGPLLMRWLQRSARFWNSLLAAEGADASGGAAGGDGGSPVELTETAYRRDSRVEVILDTAAAAAAGVGAAGAGAAVPTGALGRAQEQQLQVVASLKQAGAGDWAALEDLLMSTLAPAASNVPLACV